MVDQREHVVRSSEDFIEAMASMSEQNWGMSRMAGRIWAALLIADNEKLTADDLVRMLGASRGSVSAITRMLERVGVLQRVTQPGKRKHYYRATAASVTIDLERENLQTLHRVMSSGLEAVRGSGSPAERRLGEFIEFIAFLREEFSTIAERWNARTTHEIRK